MIRLLRFFIRTSEKISAIGILAIVFITCLDVILRQFGSSLHGSYDLVRICGGITIAAAIPLTTAVKGHVAIEYFFHKMGHRGRLFVDSSMRLLQTLFFLCATFSFLWYGLRLHRAGEVTPTLEWPLFPLAWLIAFSCFLTAAVSLFHLLRPHSFLIKP